MLYKWSGLTLLFSINPTPKTLAAWNAPIREVGGKSNGKWLERCHNPCANGNGGIYKYIYIYIHI